MLAMAAHLQGRVHALNVTDGSRAVMRMSSVAACRLLLEAGAEPVLQLACRDRNRIALQAATLLIRMTARLPSVTFKACTRPCT